MAQDTERLRLQRLANRFLWGSIASGVASFILFVPAFQNIGGRSYGIAALVLAGVSVYFNYRRRGIERQIHPHVR